MRAPPVDLAALEAFVAVVDHGGFTAGARALGLGKLVTSRRVAELERSLGERLLHRTTRAVRPTEAGLLVRAHASAVLESAAQLSGAVAAASGDPRGRMRVVANQVLYDLVLEPVVAPFMKSHPRVSLELAVSAELPSSFDFDVALVVGAPPDSTMGSLLIGRAKMGCFASPEYLAASGTPRTPEELASHAVITVGVGPRATWNFVRGSRSSAVVVHPRLVVASPNLAARAAVQGLGVARLPLFYVARSQVARGLVPILSEWTVPEVPAYAVFPSRDRPSASVRAFLDLLKERLRAGRTEQRGARSGGAAV
ncbi:MAG: LysR family transcriptional regulator [Polyangiaceae bacterium]